VACSASIEIAVYVAVSAAAGGMAVFLLWRYESPTHKASSFPDISEESQVGSPKNPELRGASQRARQDGCTAANLIGFLYHQSFGDVLVLGPRRAARKDVLARLAVLARKFESTAAETEQLLQFRWWKEQSVLQLLGSLTIELNQKKLLSAELDWSQPPVSGRFKVTGTMYPNLLVRLPVLLRVGSQMLNLICGRLGKGGGWNERSVGRTLYLADLVVYWRSVSGKNPPWKDVTVLVEGGRTAAGSLGRPRDETALRLNFTSFKKRNSQFCSDTEQSLSKYLASGSKLPFYTWYENRVKEHLPK